MVPNAEGKQLKRINKASIMIHQLIYAITFDATVDDLNKIIYIHPALQEITIDSVGTALENFE